LIPQEEKVWLTRKWFGLPVQPKASIVASMLASGYILTHDAMDKAKEMDGKYCSGQSYSWQKSIR
jgi:hypothetical protein